MLILILYKTKTNFFDETYQNKTKTLTKQKILFLQHFVKIVHLLDLLAHTFNSSILVTGAGGSLQIQGQHGLLWWFEWEWLL